MTITGETCSMNKKHTNTSLIYFENISSDTLKTYLLSDVNTSSPCSINLLLKNDGVKTYFQYICTVTVNLKLSM
jgi:hypothetical protein